MIPVFMPVHGHGGGRRNRGNTEVTGYAARILALSGLLLVLGLIVLIAWVKPRSRRVPSEFMETVTIEPIVSGALARFGSDVPHHVSSSEGTTLWWKRRYEERSFLVTAPLTGAQVTPFLSAVRDSLEQRLEGSGATRRGLQSVAWPDPGSTAGLTGPAMLSLPYATRRRVGWVALQATPGERGLVLGVFVHEGPKPTD